MSSGDNNNYKSPNKNDTGTSSSAHHAATQMNDTDGLDQIDLDLEHSDNNNNNNNIDDYFDGGSEAAGNDHQEEEDDDDDDEEEEAEFDDNLNNSQYSNGDVKESKKIVVDKMVKRHFEIDRDRIMASLPKEAKERFGEICFSKYKTYLGPVLIMNPYDVPPGPPRECWMQMYQKVCNIEDFDNYLLFIQVHTSYGDDGSTLYLLIKIFVFFCPLIPWYCCCHSVNQLIGSHM